MKFADQIGPLSPARSDATLFLEKKMAGLLKNKKSIIDIGCGKLYFLRILQNFQDEQFTYLGIDPQISKKEFGKLNRKYKIIKTDLFKFNSNKKFDIAVCAWVLEHIPQDEPALNKI